MLAEPNKTTRLRRLFPDAEFFPSCSDPRFLGVCENASDVGEGDLFVHDDDFDSTAAELAAGRGAAAVLTERLLPLFGTPQVVVPDLEQARQRLHQTTTIARPTSLRRIVVAGSSGGDRVATLTAATLAATGEPIGLRHARAEDDGEFCTPPKGPCEADWLRRCELGNVTTVVSHATTESPRRGEAAVLCLNTMRCESLGPEALSIADQRAALRAAAGLADHGGVLVTNADEPDCVRLAASHSGALITFGDTPTADLRTTPIADAPGEQTFVLTFGADSACAAIPTPGRAARRDAAAAVATSMAHGLPLHAAVAALELAPPPAELLEPISVGQPFAVLTDRGGSPHELAEACEGAATAEGRLLAVVRLADHGPTRARQLATVGRMADRVFAHGDADPAELPDNATLIDDRFTALAVALGLAEEHDAVLITGCEDGSQGTNDRESATKLIRRRLACEDRRAAA